ncbi:vWA domain-containing protein [Lutibaculum baratangense]|uniref:Carbon monoxide oxidation accessory protein CoxE n=1 Tax=Lutibaculum baratangense AMV1 TaxID=631454 RepID=V4T779_9HYPH|nr:VWA domain-containing protein [Lutibaculum baratangense]ESR22473.1 Carbon monoxide oxidation accessory protein CoxE [Lutibaculum baratangense AMV1]
MSGQGGPGVASGRLAENVVHFGRALRAAGMRVGPGAIADALQALATTGVGGRGDVYWTLHACLVKRHEDHEVFDQTFRLFFRRRGLQERMMSELLPPTPNADRSNEVRSRVADALHGKREAELPREQKPKVELDARLTMSQTELLQTKDFEAMSAAEIAVARQLVRRLVMPDDKVRTRRLVPSGRGGRIDMRRSLRASLRTGGHGVTLERRAPAERHPPVVALCDISGSMAQYSRMVLHFLHALTEARGRVHSFVFGTRLTNVTRQLAARDPEVALERTACAVSDWSGGTRITTCIRRFNHDWSRRVLGQGAVVLLVTDGLERDPDADLAREVERLKRSCRRLVWLNPLLRFDRFEPRAGGIRAILPHVDEFRPVHNLAAMRELVAALDGSAVSAPRSPRDWLKEYAA